MLPRTMQDISRHRRFIYGMAALMIMIFHMGTRFPNAGALKPLNLVQQLSGCGVEIFLLLSGTGLYRSLEKNPEIPSFYARRMRRILPPLAVCTLVFDIALYCGPLRAAVGENFVLQYLMSSAVWFVSFIALMYLLYPLIFKLQKAHPGLIWPLAAGFAALSFLLESEWRISGEAMRMVSRIPIFLAGCALAQRKRPLPRWLLPVMLPAALAFTLCWRKKVLSCGYSLRMLSYAACAVVLIMLFTGAAEWLSQGKIRRKIGLWIGFCGNYSLEIYLVFARVREAMLHIPALQHAHVTALQLDLAAAALTILLSALLGEACRRMFRSGRRSA